MVGRPDEQPGRPGSSHSHGKRTGNESGRRTLIVHIGLPKTGSTSIQRMLCVLAGSLRRRGIHVPRAGQNAPGEHRNLVHEYLGSREYRARAGRWAELSRELHESARARRFVISAESFSRQRPKDEAIPRIAGLAREADLDVRIVAYDRIVRDVGTACWIRYWRARATAVEVTRRGRAPSSASRGSRP